MGKISTDIIKDMQDIQNMIQDEIIDCLSSQHTHEFDNVESGLIGAAQLRICRDLSYIKELVRK